MITRSVHCSLAACTAAAMLAGCGGSQLMVPPPTMPSTQNAVHVPDASTACAVRGKKYTTGTSKGHVSLTAGREVVPLGPTITVRFTLTYSDWPQNRRIVRYKPQLVTCGPASGKAPLGEVVGVQASAFGSDCHSGICAYNYTYYERYKPPQSLKRKKPWKFDYIRWVPAKPTNGYNALPHFTIQINP